MNDTPTGTVRGVMLDTVDLDGTAEFWMAMLGLDTVYRDDRYVYLAKNDETAIQLAFQLVPEAKAAKNRMHLDVEVPDREAFIARVEELGGSIIREHQEGELPVWNVVADPQGNEFCIYSRKQTA